MLIKKKPELLAPAGNLEKLKTALAHGADAVYCGLPDFSLRTRVNDFSLEDIAEGIKYAHKLGKRVYVTLNILAHEDHLNDIKEHVKVLKEIGPDAIFIADPGVAEIVKEIWPEVKLSLSTQANCTNSASAAFWAKQGFKRLILSRELSLHDIALIKKGAGDTEIEVFVHGALCSSYSGRCFLSDYFIDRSANQGDCAQPCRWEYEIKPLGHKKSLIIKEDNHGSYLLNSKDLCLIERLPEIMAAGVDACKIEGRAKSVYYLANVVGAYRQAIDLIFDDKNDKKTKKVLQYLRTELELKLNHRGYTEGFMFKGDDHLQNYEGNFPSSEWEFCGQVLSSKSLGDKFAVKIKVHNTLLASDEVEIIGPAYKTESLSNLEMKDEKTGEIITEAHGGGGEQKLIIICDQDWPPLSVLRRKIPKIALS
ncbi:U32 family peptidase [Patescibacteria group bacterium]|nr:U32 family peptidase [Patescibacteria group bacterium]